MDFEIVASTLNLMDFKLCILINIDKYEDDPYCLAGQWVNVKAIFDCCQGGGGH